jgi:hypothetical protein
MGATERRQGETGAVAKEDVVIPRLSPAPRHTATVPCSHGNPGCQHGKTALKNNFPIRAVYIK